MIEASEIVGVLLAGGLARRMGGGDKSMQTVGGVPILDRVISRALLQVGTMILNANGDPSRFETFGLPIVADVLDEFPGPLAGVLTAMEWAREHQPQSRWVASFATDAPFLPKDMIERLTEAQSNENAMIVCARSNGRAHPVFALWSVALADDLRRAMVDEGMRKIDAWTARHRLIHVDFEVEDVDPFFNVNKPENLAEADAWAATLDGEAA